MHDIAGLIGTLRRPNLLVRAARFGVDDYRRNLHLPRLLNRISLPRSAEAILQLLDLEAGLNRNRLERTADYSVGRHVEVLIAMLGEARLIRAAARAAAAPPVRALPDPQTRPAPSPGAGAVTGLLPVPQPT